MVKITKLRDFYLLDNKLLYVSEDFIGYDPLISKELSRGSVKGKCNTEKIKRDKFELGGSSFKTILTDFFDYGPLRGYRRMQIFKNGKALIFYERGGMGHGSNYSKGSSLAVKSRNAYLVADGNAMRDFSTDKIYRDFSANKEYLLWFKDIVIPKKKSLTNMKSRIIDVTETCPEVAFIL